MLNEKEREEAFIARSVSRTLLNLADNPMWHEEHRKNSSIAHSGKNHQNYGKHLSEETREKIRKGNLGKKLSSETIMKIKKARRVQTEKGAIPSGVIHWNWKGGISSTNDKIRKSLKFRQWREKVFERDEYACQFCKIRNKKGVGKTIEMHPHHIIPVTDCLKLNWEEEIYDVDNGITLCRECHFGGGLHG